VVAPVEEAEARVEGRGLPPAELETIRAELRPAVADIVRLLVLDLARAELGRLAATLDGRPPPTAETVLLGIEVPQETPRALPEGSDPPPAARAARKVCSTCGKEKAARAFERGRRTCRACRSEASRRNYRERQARARAEANGANGGEPEADPG
jgi:hypothetical protein